MPMTATAIQPLDAVAVPLAGLASAAREVCGSFACPLSPAPSLAPVQDALCADLAVMILSSVAACDSGHWGPDCIHPCNCSAGQGSCDAISGLCLCEAGYDGPRCEQCESWSGPCTLSHFAPRQAHAYSHTHSISTSMCIHVPEYSGAHIPGAYTLPLVCGRLMAHPEEQTGSQGCRSLGGEGGALSHLCECF